MPIDLARRVGQALDVRSETRIRDLDRALESYARLVPQAKSTQALGTIDTSQVVSGTFADARIAETNVTQYEGALEILEAQITDLGTYLEELGTQTTVGSAGTADALPSNPTGYIDVGSNRVVPFYDQS